MDFGTARGLFRRRHIDAEVLFFVGDEGNALGRDPIDERRQDFGSELDSVQRLDQFGLRELTLGASCRECRFEVDLRHAGRKRDMRDRTPACPKARQDASTFSSSITTADSSLTVALPTLSLLGLPLSQPRYQSVGRVAT